MGYANGGISRTFGLFLLAVQPLALRLPVLQLPDPGLHCQCGQQHQHRCAQPRFVYGRDSDEAKDGVGNQRSMKLSSHEFLGYCRNCFCELEFRPTAMKTLLIAITFSLALGATGALAQRIENRKDRQDARVNQGVQSGELTNKEAARLKARQANLNRKIRQDRKDGGGMTAAERARIEQRQDNISRDIYRQKNDAQKK